MIQKKPKEQYSPIEVPLEVDLTVIGSLRHAFVARRDTAALT